MQTVQGEFFLKFEAILASHFEVKVQEAIIYYRK